MDSTVALADERVAERQLPVAAHPGNRFQEPWMRRVRDVDDDTLVGLLKTLIGLRRLKTAVAGVAAATGALLFGFLEVKNPVYAMLIYATLSAFVCLPALAGGSLAVRRLFLQEAQRQGLARSTSTLVLIRAERRARFLLPWRREDDKIEALLQAVRDPDRA